MPGIDFREVRSRVSMTEVLELLGFEARGASGKQLRGPCPLHGSGKNSRVFSVNLAKNTYQCFKCGAAGNHLDLWAGATIKSYYDAALDLCQRLNREIPWLPSEQRNHVQVNARLGAESCETQITITDPCHPLFGRVFKLADTAQGAERVRYCHVELSAGQYVLFPSPARACAPHHGPKRRC